MTLVRQRRRRLRPFGDRRGVRVEWVLRPGDLAAVPRLRHRIMERLREIAAVDADLDATELVVAELLNNAIAHTGGPAWVSLRWDGVHPLLSVADVGPGFGAARSRLAALVDPRRTLTAHLPADPMAESGRGLYLVARLALDVAVAARATGGTVVSVTLDLKRAS